MLNDNQERRKIRTLSVQVVRRRKYTYSNICNTCYVASPVLLSDERDMRENGKIKNFYFIRQMGII